MNKLLDISQDITICKMCIYGFKKFLYKYRKWILLGIGTISIMVTIYIMTKRHKLTKRGTKKLTYKRNKELE